MKTGDQDYEEIQRIFLAAVELDDPEEREACLKEACGVDRQLRETIDALLREYEEGSESSASVDPGGPESSGAVGPSGPESVTFVPGTIVAGRYRIVSLLGRGGMGEVYRADDLKLDQPVALKFLPAALSGDAQLLKALCNEVRLARRVSHRHVGRVHDIEEGEGLHFLSMEYIEGEDLGSLLRRIGRMPGDKAVQLGCQLCAGLQAAHEERLLHLDLKPGNLMIDRKGDLRVTDFGLARLANEAAAEKRRAGTPAYMAPEQLLQGRASQGSDIYAVGLVLYEMATGKRLCSAKSLEEIKAFQRESGPAAALSEGGGMIDPEFDAIVRRCLAADPDERPSSIAEVLEILQTVSLRHDSRPLPDPGDPPEPIEALKDTGPSPEALPGSDVYLTYAAIDDEPLIEGRPGWVSQFHRNLEVRAEQLLGEKVSIWRPMKTDGCDEVDATVLQHLPEVKAMVSVVSPRFAHSQGCLREVATFHDGVGGRFRVENRPRLLPAVKTPVDSRELISLSGAFEGLSGFEFYEKDPVTGRIREFEEAFGEEARQHYYERVYDLAFDLCNILKACERASLDQHGEALAVRSSGRTIYLAATTSDLEVHYDCLRRELLEQGHHVLPNAPLPLHQADLESAVCQYLEQCDCIIQIVGPTYGMVPENARHSLLELQNNWSGQRARQSACPRFIWMPRGMMVEDDRQLAFVNRLREIDAAESATELLEGTLSAFRDRVVQRLAPTVEQDPGSAGPAAPAANPGSNGPPLVYLICDQGEEEAVEALEDYLFEKGLQVDLPEFTADQDEVSALHREQLKECDAVIVYYGAARKAWVDIKLRDVIKANGYGREAPIAHQAVYVAPPNDRRKERLRAHGASIIRQASEGFAPNAALDAFIESITKTEAADA